MKFALDSYGDNQEVAMALGAQHWRELYGDVEFKADSAAIARLEQAGGLAYFTARDDEGLICGQAAFLVFDAPFLGSRIANDAFFYVRPEFREIGVMADLLRCAGETLKASGVSSVVASHHLSQDLSKLLGAAGYRHASNLYTFEGA